jgi:hypothetical protein
MRTHCQAHRRLQQGISLTECLVYIAVLAVLMSVGGFTVAKAWDQSRALSRSTTDIHRTVNTGERWRADIRAANGQIQAARTGDGETLRIPTAAGTVEYQWAKGELSRRANAQAPWVKILPRVKASHMQREPRGNVIAWRWEVELEPSQKKSRLRPLFTFLAVPGKELAP